MEAVDILSPHHGILYFMLIPCTFNHITWKESHKTCVLLITSHFQAEKKLHGHQQCKTPQILLLNLFV